MGKIHRWPIIRRTKSRNYEKTEVQKIRNEKTLDWILQSVTRASYPWRGGRVVECGGLENHEMSQRYQRKLRISVHLQEVPNTGVFERFVMRRSYWLATAMALSFSAIARIFFIVATAMQPTVRSQCSERGQRSGCS